MVLQVTNSPFNQEQVELLNRLLPTLTETQRIWLNGYLAAIQGSAVVTTSSAVPVAPLATLAANAPVLSKEVTVLFGSQTGKAQGLAKKMSKKLEEQGFQVTLSSMADFKPNNLKKIQNLLVLVSTHGEGDPPDNAISFHEFLHSKRAPKLEDLRFSVLSLGDTSYELFCQTGKDFDKRLEELGGKRLAPRVDCDVDFDEPAAEWMSSVLGALSEASAVSNVGSGAGAAVESGTESEYSRTNPFQAEVLENLNLNGRGSDRETRHIEISLEGSNLQYEPGDCLGIYPENHPRLVDELIEAMGWKSEELVTINKNGEKRTLREALLRNYEITVLTKPLLEQAAKLNASNGLQELLVAGREQDLKSYLSGRDLLDLVQDYSFKGVSAGEFVAILRKMPARLYSIASSSKAFPDEVHVTVRTVRYEARGRERYGVCSVQLAERIKSGETLPVYIQNNPNFKLPENPETPIIMIGPGTGVAPFRAFLGEREETGAEGKSWLFYGDQHFSTDFLYQIEWQKWLKDGVLTRMDVAFSRDTDQKVYVQHRMLEKSAELYKWLQEGASVYVCGDEKKMAHDVHATLATIIEQEGGFSSEEAAEYLTRMQQQKRYQRDVY
ncbi:assimilatory sulfite reductase (NADPH) flavoprotein subunit [Paenibacillus alginolyticus]|uniref:Assimilatory sulfite reductase (NADPH) flavoprotein subunit n=1 Tax=Paenibacillus alginolyticus TaxID=59839 RepID=A0ABT4GGJ2_9BACL|nr:assimilatory sulfite reductase (NADPH) flavoprotein subunit [Paenibacillus alginolyticus]MCY9668401.1 assimilatory sulfite reductase (NADPH) flavoprotein subunit [Paenibacillus alginolyticus]MCY9695311.1 assimilatory sulfite reductase (NADPH) flavoprotein subunit [Paenibacillus alginolyticus]MEC0144797.1 assimilatory sulfite reductase (NADPH) flavoprotein subunit [Paenibacillus alginolyticus]